MYGIMYGVKRTTVYFPEQMKAAIEREAARRGVTEAEVIRSAVAASLEGQPSRRRKITPAVPEGVRGNIAGRTEEMLVQMADDLWNEIDL